VRVSGAAYIRQGFGAQLQDHVPGAIPCSFSAAGALCLRGCSKSPLLIRKPIEVNPRMGDRDAKVGFLAIQNFISFADNL
jgi:hypothetical protein